MKAKILFYLTLIILFFESCSTLNIAELSRPSNKLKIDSLNLRAGYEIYNLRIDLLRSTTTETISASSGDGNTTATSKTVEVPYHYLGVYLFEGVFLDLNNNLSFNVIDFLENPHMNDFQIRQKAKFKSKSPFSYVVTRQGNRVTCENKNLIGKSITYISLSDNKMTIEGKGLSNNQDIIINPYSITYEPHGIFGKLSKTEIVRTTDGFMVPRFGKDLEFKQPELNAVELGKHLLVKNYGDKIEFVFSGIFGSNSSYTLLKLKDGYVFYDKKNRGLRIKIDKNQIFVEQNGKMINYFEFSERN